MSYRAPDIEKGSRKGLKALINKRYPVGVFSVKRILAIRIDTTT